MYEDGEMNMFETFDVTVPIGPSTPVWEGDPRPEITLAKSLAEGGSSNVSRLTMGVHTATHVDAPAHFIEGGANLDTVPLSTFVGHARVFDLRGKKVITARDLEPLLADPVERILLRTDNSNLWSDPKFHTDFTSVDESGAKMIVSRGVRLVGVDYLGIEKPANPGHPVHRTLLAAGVIILEGLNLLGVPPGDYELICLPLALVATEAAPARVILRRSMEA